MNIPENYFIFIDVLIGLVLLAMVIIGYIKGLVYELISVAYTVASVLLAWFVSPVLANLYPLVDLSTLCAEYAQVLDLLNLNPLVNTIIYFVIVFLVLKILYFIIQVIAKGFNKIPVLGQLNKILGALIGLLNGILICMAITLLFSMPIFSNGTEIKEKTVLKYVDNITTVSMNYVLKNVDFSNIKNTFENFDIDQSREDLKKFLS